MARPDLFLFLYCKLVPDDALFACCVAAFTVHKLKYGHNILTGIELKIQ